MKTIRNQIFAHMRFFHREQRGAEVAEWIAMVAVILLLLVAASAVFDAQGSAVGQEITTSVNCWVGNWTNEGCTADSGSVAIAQPAASNPAAPNPVALVNPGNEETSSSPAEDPSTLTDSEIEDLLNDAMDGWGTDEDAIKSTINGLTDAQKQAILNNADLMDRLYSELGRSDMLEVLAALGADPATQLNEAMNGWGTDEDAIKSIINGLTDAEKQAILNDSDLMQRLDSELGDSDMAEVLEGLNAGPHTQLAEAIDEGKDKDALVEIVTNASEAEREVIWSDTELKEQIRAELGTEGYLDFLVEAEMIRSGTAGHMAAAEADSLIQTHLGTYLGDALADGRQITGQVAVVDDDDWNIAGIARYGEDVWKTKNLNGFVDTKGRVWIHKDRGTGTMVHEAVHKYSDDAMIYVSQPLNEGVTEYFTRSTFDSTASPPARANYQSNYRFVQDLVNLVGEDTVAEAYFDGDMDGLRDAYIDAGKTEADWNQMIEHTQKGKWTDARKLAR